MEIKGKPHYAMIDKLYQKFEQNALIDKKIDSINKEIAEKAKEHRDNLIEIVYWQLRANRSLNEALNDVKVPLDEREDFIDDLLTQYPDSKDLISR